MDTAAFDTDATLALLTEALRRGPGSPEWHRAIADLRDSTDPHADEYRLLVTARERLESGRQYREVRAGPAFTRELFGRLGAAPAAPRRPSVALLVGLLCLLTLAAVLGAVVMKLASAGPAEPASPLGGRLFVTPLRSWTFSAGLPKDLRPAGPLPLDVRAWGLRAGGRDLKLPAEGELFDDTPIDLAHGACLELSLDHRGGPTAVQLLLTQRPLTAATTTPVPAETAIVCDTDGVHFRSPTDSPPPRPLRNGPHVLRLKVVGDAAVAEVDGQVLWTGRPTVTGVGYAGVRFVRTGAGGPDTSVQSLRVLAP